LIWDHPGNRTNNQQTGFWNKCSKEEICQNKEYGPNNLRPAKIRPVKTDPEYLDNWVEKLDLLCEPKHRLGMLGSAYFVGITSSMFVIPKMADIWGRKPMFIVTMVLSLVG